MTFTIGQTIFAIGFKHHNDFFDVHYTVETIDRPAKRHYYALTVVEERDTVCEHTSQPVIDKKGYILVDQYGVKWNRNWPAYDSSGRGLIFERNTEGMTSEQIQHIFRNEVCECRDISGFFSTLIMETEDLSNPPKHKVVENETPEAIGKRRETVAWMTRHRNNVVSEIKEFLFVDVSFTPHTDKDGKVLDEKRFVKALLEDVDFSDAAVKAMTFMAMFGDLKNWAHIFLGHLDFEWACHAHFEVFGKFPSNTKHLRDPKIREHMDMMKRNMRNHMQGLVDGLAEKSEPKTFILDPTPKYTPPVSSTSEAKQFRDMNKPSDFGTIAEICAKYGISKSEARRRKAEGTLHELNQ